MRTTGVTQFYRRILFPLMEKKMESYSKSFSLRSGFVGCVQSCEPTYVIPCVRSNHAYVQYSVLSVSEFPIDVRIKVKLSL
jgi:hypothetical protein